jgi:polyisoprenoid-binding protein YceI
MKDPKGKEHMGAAATTTVSRQAFGVGSDSNMIGDEISIVIDVEMVKQ